MNAIFTTLGLLLPNHTSRRSMASVMPWGAIISRCTESSPRLIAQCGELVPGSPQVPHWVINTRPSALSTLASFALMPARFSAWRSPPSRPLKAWPSGWPSRLACPLSGLNAAPSMCCCISFSDWKKAAFLAPPPNPIPSSRIGGNTAWQRMSSSITIARKPTLNSRQSVRDRP